MTRGILGRFETFVAVLPESDRAIWRRYFDTLATEAGGREGEIVKLAVRVAFRKRIARIPHRRAAETAACLQ